MFYQNFGRQFKQGDVSEEDVLRELIQMEQNPELDTKVSLVKARGTTARLMTFQEKHLVYLREHPKMDPMPYLANLKVMLKIRK